jgi:hypothetical protein
MKTKEYTGAVDRSRWAAGPWDDEPLDKRQWADPSTGLPCLAVRGPLGAWCGYVGVPEGHPMFGMDYDKVDGEFGIEVHGGLTFEGFCQPEVENRGICHVVEPGEDDRVWWLGFDTGHAHDLVPSTARYADFPDMTYRTLDYVVEQVADLARQIKNVRPHLDM